MIHRGQLLLRVFLKSGLSKKYVYGALGRSRGWLDYQFTRENIPLEELQEIGELLHHDFAASLETERGKEPLHVAYDKLKVEHEQLQSKYMQLLEEHARVLKQLHPDSI